MKYKKLVRFFTETIEDIDLTYYEASSILGDETIDLVDKHGKLLEELNNNIEDKETIKKLLKCKYIRKDINKILKDWVPKENTPRFD